MSTAFCPRCPRGSDEYLRELMLSLVDPIVSAHLRMVNGLHFYAPRNVPLMDLIKLRTYLYLDQDRCPPNPQPMSCPFRDTPTNLFRCLPMLETPPKTDYHL